METIGKGPSEKKNEGEKKTRIYVLFGLLLGLGIGLVLGIFKLLGPFLSILAGIAGFVAGIFIFRPLTVKKAITFDNIDGVTKETFDTALKEGNAKLTALRASTDKIRDINIKEKAKKICILTKKILDSIKNDPKDLKPARSFLNYYLETAMNILKQYNDIVDQKGKSKEVDEVIDKVDRTLGTLEQAFEKQLARLMENDVLILDTELTVLERTIEMEGFGRDSDQ